MEKNINIRVPEKLLRDFEQACEANYTTKSEVLRQAMAGYIKKHERLATVKVIKAFGSAASRQRAEDLAKEINGRVVAVASLTPEQLEEVGLDIYGMRGGSQYEYAVVK